MFRGKWQANCKIKKSFNSIKFFFETISCSIYYLCWFLISFKRGQEYIPGSFFYKILCVNDNFTKPVVLYREKNAINRFIETILEEYHYYKKVMKKHFNDNLVMSEKDEQRFQSSNKCCICDKLFNVRDNNVRDHCHITGKFRGFVDCSFNINLKLTKKIPVIFHTWRGYDSQLIIKE